MRCFCCEANDATHLVKSELTNEQVPYCDECDGDIAVYDDELIKEFESELINE